MTFYGPPTTGQWPRKLHTVPNRFPVIHPGFVDLLFLVHSVAVLRKSVFTYEFGAKFCRRVYVRMFTIMEVI